MASKARAKQDQSELEQSLTAENARLKRKPAELSEALAIVKRRHILRQEPAVKYVFMNGHQGTFRVSAMSRILQVSRSELYAWRKWRDNPSPPDRSTGNSSTRRSRRHLMPARAARDHPGWC